MALCYASTPRTAITLPDNSKPPRPGRLLALGVLPLLTLILGWQLGSNFQEQRQLRMPSEVTNPQTEVDMSLLWNVWNLLLENYIDPSALKTEEMLFGAIGGLVRGVGDPYSTFMTPKENTDFLQSLNGILQGIGAELMEKDGAIVVVAPLRGSPAERAGLQPEDIILSVDGEPLAGFSLGEAVQKIRGPKGSTVVLLLAREGVSAPFEVSIVRDEITVPSVESELKETASGKVLLITVNQFGDNTVTEVKNFLAESDDGNLRGLIIDVRYNGGGYLDRAVELTSLFLQEGLVVSVQRREGDPTKHYVSGQTVDTDTPMVVLINEGTASASEIFAGAIQDHERGIVIGKQSFGKGTVQEIFELANETSLRLTVARWITPDGRDLSKEGITPDFVVEQTAEDTEADRDPQLDAAIQWLTEGGVTTGTGTTAQ